MLGQGTNIIAARLKTRRRYAAKRKRMRHAGHFHGRYDKTEAFTKVAEEKGSPIPRQPQSSAMMIFA
jgi:hypothetical protein